MILVTSFILLFSFYQVFARTPINDRPIIGIVTEECNSTIAKYARSNIWASYVKFLESGGARVVPIWIYQSEEYYRNIMSQINGVLFPGGPGLFKTKGYSRTLGLIYQIAVEMNDDGNFFPLWGTCLGFEVLTYLAVGGYWLKDCPALDLATNVEFTNDASGSKMFQDLDASLQNQMQTKNVAYHFHEWCITTKNFTLSGLDKHFKVLAVNRDLENTTFVSIIEGKQNPFFGVMFHPEKVMFEWVESQRHHNIPHSIEAVRTSQYFANFFVNEARKSFNHFRSKKEENAALIYNYNPVFTGQYGTNPSVQTYYFTQ